MRNIDTSTKKRIRTSIKVAFAVAAAAAIAVGGCVITFASRGYKGQYQTAYLDGKEVSARYGQLNDHGWTFEVRDNGISYNVWLEGDYTPDQDTLYISDMGDYMIACINEEPTLNLYDRIADSPYGEFVEDENGSYIAVLVIVKGEQLNTMKLDLTYDESDGTKDGLVNDKFENPNRDDFIITSYTVGPKGEIIYSFKGDDDGDEAIEMLWGLIWGEESEENIQQYYQDNYDRK